MTTFQKSTETGEASMYFPHEFIFDSEIKWLSSSMNKIRVNVINYKALL